nr:MAG TPA: hypothetical protein [Caudoviricetes sp.]
MFRLEHRGFCCLCKITAQTQALMRLCAVWALFFFGVRLTFV